MTNHNLTFYLFTTNKSLEAVNVIISEQYYELKIESKETAFNLYQTRSGWFNFRSCFTRSQTNGPDIIYSIGNYFSKTVYLSQAKEVRSCELKLLSSQALAYLNKKYFWISPNQIKIVRILFGQKFNLKKHTLVVIDTGVVCDNEMLVDKWVGQIQNLVKIATSLSYFDQLRLWYLKDYKIASAEASNCDRLEVWKHFLRRSRHAILPDPFINNIEILEYLLHKYNPAWRDSPFHFKDFCFTAREFLHSPQTIHSIFSFSTDSNNGDSPIPCREYLSPRLMDLVETTCRYFTFIENNLNTTALPKPEETEAENNEISKHEWNMLKIFVNRFLQRNQPIPENFKYSSKPLLDYLFSEHNSIWDPMYLQLSQDMTKPLSHYWINSSHNTYLTGDQIRSDSSTESYARALRQGCRCIEIDVTNGKCNRPVVTHVKTLTTTVLLKDVLKTISENAFRVSEYPVIISVENHCNLKQQRKMAKLFRTIFGKALLAFDDSSTSAARKPAMSPSQLKNKIILNGKKLSWIQNNCKTKEEDMTSEENLLDLDFILSGELWLTSENGIWKPSIFVLTNNNLFYTDKEKSNPQNPLSSSEVEVKELRVGRPRIIRYNKGSRRDVEKFLMQRRDKESFVVWRDLRGSHISNQDDIEMAGPSKNMDNSGSSFPLVQPVKFTFSFCGFNKVFHLRVNEKPDIDSQIQFYLTASQVFPSIGKLMKFYKDHPIQIHELLLAHQEWIYKEMDDAEAARMLEKIHLNGTFLVRYKWGCPSEIVISFRFHDLIKHCHIKKEEGWLVMSGVKFQTLMQLIYYYKNNAFYLDMKLGKPVGRTLYRLYGESDGTTQIANHDFIYSTTNTLKSRAIAVQSYKSKDPDLLLSFKKGDMINNIVKEDDGWWWGTNEASTEKDYFVPKQFCSSFVEEISEVESPFGIAREFRLGIKAKIKRCNDKIGRRNGFKHYIHIKDCDGGKRQLGATCSRRKLNKWIDLINFVMEKDTVKKNKMAKFIAGKKANIAPEFSDLIFLPSVAKKLDPAEIGNDKSKICTTSVKSLNEVDGDQIFRSNPAYFVWYHQHAMTRIYPKGMRVDSSNYSPVRLWNFGSQMVALNFQNPDRAMQLNRGKFRQNGNCGYVLKPDILTQEPNFDPTNLSANQALCKELNLQIDIISARLLQNSTTGAINPFVQIEMTGVDEDCTKVKTNSVETGLNPYWNSSYSFTIKCPELAMVQFIVYETDMFGDKLLLGESTIPVNCMRKGHRSVQLYNGYGEPLLSSLLVNVVKLE